MTTEANAAEIGDRKVTLTRFLEASPQQVWDAWTQPERLALWFGTAPYRTPASAVEMDVRPGGQWSATQVSDVDGAELPFAGTYREVVAPERLIFTFENPADRSDPNTELATLTLAEHGNGTRMVFVQEGHLPQEQYGLLAQGYSHFFDRLAESLAG
jgi:uncharacterized protein YndB with AHSA1/START domain